MKSITLMSILVLVLASLVFVTNAQAVEVMAVTMSGTVIDNACASSHSSDLAEFIKTHTKECTLMPPCVLSGYAIYSDGKLYKFDKASNAKVEKFLRGEASKLQVTIVAKKTGEELELVSIENQK